MKSNNFKLIKIIVGAAISLAALISCNNGNSSDTTNTSHLGNFTVTTNNTMALNGSEWVYVALGDSWNNQVANIKVTNSDNSIITISHNTCTQLNWETDSCKFFLQGTNIGSSIITVLAAGFNSVVEPMNVDRNWGIIGGDQRFGFGQLSISGSKIYAQTAYDRSSPFIYVSESGQPWQILGNGQAYESGLGNSWIASDESYVCASADGVVDQTSKGVVSCIKNGSSWKQLPDLPGAFFEGISIFQGNVYVELFDADWDNVKYCSIDNCTAWQQLGQSFPNHDIVSNLALGIFESTALMESGKGVYFLDSDGSWKLYGTYTPGTSGYIRALYTESGVFVMPLNESFVGPYNHQIEYNSLFNLGDNFRYISNGIHINKQTTADAYPALAYVHNTIYASTEDGNIYASININGMWSEWAQVGNNTVAICSIYTNNDGTMLYSTYTDASGNDQVYAYSVQ